MNAPTATDHRHPAPGRGTHQHAGIWRRLFCASAILIFTFAFHSQARTLVEALSGKTHPLTIKLKDLNGDWRRITVHRSAGVSGNVSVNVSGNNSPQNNNNFANLGGTTAYATKGRTLSIAGQAYLVAYHLPSSALDLGSLIQVAMKRAPEISRLTPDTALPLSLLELKSLGSLDDVRAFDGAAEIAESERAAEALAALLKTASGGGSTNSTSSSSAAKQPPAK